MLECLCPVVGETAVDAFCARLNLPGQDRLAAVWEVAVLFGLSTQGNLCHERQLASGRRPDIDFDGETTFIADVTCVSDRGLEEENPFDELCRRLEVLKNRLGLPCGGLDVQVAARQERTKRGPRTRLRIPERSRLDDFLRTEVAPALRAQLRDGRTVLTIDLDDDNYGLRITIDPRRSPYSTGGHPSYNRPTIKDRNPLSNALHAKADQLRGAKGLVGIVACDGSCAMLGERPVYPWNEYGIDEVVADVMRQYTSVGFVLLLGVREESQSLLESGARQRRMTRRLYPRNREASIERLDSVFAKMLTAMPPPLMTAVNARHRAHENRYILGHRGGHTMAGRKLRIGSREVLEVLAGRRTAEQMNEAHGWRERDAPVVDRPQKSPFARFLDEGLLPVSIAVSRDENAEDDWLEIEFGDPDPAIIPFCRRPGAGR